MVVAAAAIYGRGRAIFALLLLDLEFPHATASVFF